MTALEEAVATVLRALRPGDVVTYGEVAEEAGFPGRARFVGRYLAGTDGDVAWWRVVAADGRLVPGKEREHARLLRAEGVEVGERGVVGMRRRSRRRADRGSPPRGSSR